MTILELFCGRSHLAVVRICLVTNKPEVNDCLYEMFQKLSGFLIVRYEERNVTTVVIEMFC